MVASYSVFEGNAKVSERVEKSDPHHCRSLRPIWILVQIYHCSQPREL